MNKIPGKLIIFSGPMFSGKTDILIKKINFLKNKKILVFKSRIFDRNKKEIIIKSRTNDFCFAISIVDWNDIEIYINNHIINNNNLYAIAIDEVHFFSIDFVDFIDKVLDKGINVFLAGLDRGFSDNVLPTMNRLFALADEIHKFTAWCGKCGKQANKTQRIDENRKPISPIIKNMKDFIGGKNLYEPRCRNCFVKF